VCVCAQCTAVDVKIRKLGPRDRGRCCPGLGRYCVHIAVGCASSVLEVAGGGGGRLGE